MPVRQFAEGMLGFKKIKIRSPADVLRRGNKAKQVIQTVKFELLS
jgi:hypothetical protein